ncbi:MULTISPECIES: hypothetical protein [Rhizobium]|uniref:hypothetical protein n=1 Tax=Rhizobium TaxID=379 RepID=UPI001C9040BA|nr:MULTISPECIES: hypothetical protein [Rhizobium]MBY3266795.1 hypothetical protein [Rhizobium laguerreae]MBY3342015.1 hypothetical protein [Rhizobium laguerreae]MBY3397583.1 hypothetical protein [Rhizobium laguerreae]MBY5664636.1 hypothetical protein [Rhizobium leguminosarum]MBY5677886.1 hypothetical protein [Rhizobium leguminosarum]
MSVSSNAITVLASTLINYNAVEPTLQRLDDAGVETILFVPDRYREFVEQRLRWTASRTRSYNELVAKARIMRLAHRYTELLVAGPGFSETYRFREWDPACSKAGPAGISLRLRSAFPSARRQEINAYLERLYAPFVPKVFPSNRILVVTRSDVRHLLCHPDLDVVSLMESWDHPPKAPMGYRSDTAFVWNRALERDWREFQGDEDIRIGYPFKLRYVLEGHQKQTAGKTAVLYPASFSKRSDPTFFAAELRLLKLISEATRKLGIELIVKPKPNGMRGEFDYLLDEGTHVSVAGYKDNDGSTGYFLDEQYNAERLELLSRCFAVINLGTTFAIDAAAARIPIIQLRLNDQARFPELTQANRWVHLDRHFFSKPELLCRISADDDPVDKIANSIKNTDQAQLFCNYLFEWISPEQTAEEAISHIARRLFQ